MNQADPKKLIAVMHRIDTKGGQERSTLEVLGRLAAGGTNVEFYGFELERCALTESFRFHKVPGKNVPIQWLKNLWFAIYTYFKLPQDAGLIVTTGVSSWRADCRVVQYCHTAFGQLMAAGQVSEPNPRSWLHRKYQRFFTWWNAMLEKRLFPKTKHLVAISESVRSDLVSKVGVAAAKISVIHHASDEVDARELSERVGSPLRLLFVGALERKGIQTVLSALAEVTREDWQLDVLGAGFIDYWRDQASQLGIAERVTFHGVKPAQEYFPQADAFVFPSRYEPYGLVVSEAASHGLILLVSQECGAMELWHDLPPRLKLSAFDEPREWADAISWVLDHDKQRVTLANTSRAAFQNWTWDKAAHDYRELFATLS